MIDQYELYNKAILHFHRRSDVRKRKVSNGSKVLRAIYNEADFFNKSIEELRASFFAIHYKGRANDILLDLQCFFVGNPSNITIDGLVRLEEETAFVNNKNAFYIEDGMCYIHPQSEELITYVVDGIAYKSEVDNVKMWNIIDEFALISSIERLEGEDNEALLSRVFDAYKYIPNSTEDGLKNAVKNVTAESVFVNTDDIRIDPMNESFIYDVFNGTPLIEELGEINRDALRNKIWGKSKWEHGFAKIDYASPKWDEELPSVQDGVGDMGVTYAKDVSNELKKKVVIDTYETSEKEIASYMLSNNIDVEIPLSLTKLSNQLQAKLINYRVDAEKATDISDAILKLYNEFSGEVRKPLYQLLASPYDYRNHFITNHYLRANKTYTLTISSPGGYNPMRIRDISLHTATDIKNLMVDQTGFYRDNNNYLVPSNVLSHIDTTEGLFNATGLETTADGIILKDTAVSGYAEVPIANAANKYVNVKYSCPTVSFIDNNAVIKKMDYKRVGDKLVSLNSNAYLEINLTCTELSFDILTGKAEVSAYIDGVLDEALSRQIVNETYSLSFDKTKNVKLIVHAVGLQENTFENFVYANYSVAVSAEGATLLKTNNGYVVSEPSEDAKLIINVTSTTGFSPIIEYVHIGGITNGKTYTVSFTTTKESYLFIDTDGDISVKLNGAEVNIDKELIIRNDTEEALNLKLSKDRYENLVIEGYKLTKLFTASKEDLYISLPAGKDIGTSIVRGTFKKALYEKAFSEILSTVSPIYVSSFTDGLMINGSFKKVDLSKIGVPHNRVEVLTDKDVRFSFYSNGVTQEGTVVKKQVSEIGCIANRGQQHTGYYSEKMLSVSKDKVEIPNPLYPSVDPIYDYFYKVSTTSGANITFENTNTNYSIGLSTIKIKLDGFAADEANYIKETIVIKKNTLLSSLMYLDRTFAKGNKSMDLSEYMIEPPSGLELTYAEENEERSESFFAENDGFNKLTHSNIVAIESIKINGITVSPSKYALMNKEGVICWIDESLYGSAVDIKYTYKVPYALKVNDLSYLYERVGYNVETMKHIAKLVFETRADAVTLSDDEYAQILNAKSYTIAVNNEKYRAELIGRKLVLSLVYDNDEILVKSGYYYRSGNEYYHFAQPYETDVSGAAGIKVHNGTKYGTNLYLNQESENFMPNSKMILNKIEPVSVIDFVNEYNVNAVKTVNACDAINYWMLDEMNLEFIDNAWQQGAKFTKTNKYGRATLWLNPLMENRTIISIKADTQPSIGVGYVSALNEPLIKSHAITKQLKTEQVGKSNLFIFDAKEYIENEVPIYLIIEEDTELLDVIAMDVFDKKAHARNGETFGLNFTPKRSASEIITMPFNSRDVRYSDIEVDNNVLRNGTNIYWGYTPIKQYGKDWADVSVNGLDILKESWVVNRTNSGTLLTRTLAVPKHKYVTDLAIHLKELTKYGVIHIAVETSATKNGQYQNIFSGKKGKSDVIAVDAERLKNYVRIRLEIIGEAALSELDIYARYNSSDGKLKTSVVEDGSAQTKYYDIGSTCNVRCTAEATGEGYQIVVRGIRQNNSDLVATKWYDVEEAHIFEGYRYIQYEIRLLSKDAYATIKHFQMEVL